MIGIGAGGSAHPLPRIGSDGRESRYRDIHSDGTNDTLVLGNQDVPKTNRRRTFCRLTREAFVNNALFTGQNLLSSYSVTITTDFPKIVAPPTVLDITVGLAQWYISADAGGVFNALRHIRGET